MVETNKKYFNKFKDYEDYYNRGYNYLSINKYKLALKDFNLLIKINPNKIDGYLARAECLRKLKNYKKAIRDYKKALKLDVSFIESIYYGLSALFIETKEYKKSIYYSNKLIDNKISMSPYSAYNLRGEAYFKLKNYKNALKDFNKAINVYPKYSAAYYNRGCLFFKLKEYNMSLSDLLTAKKLEQACENTRYILINPRKIENKLKQLKKYL
ncbi:tetratricopeptide repeat protein [bacterium]|nr:tetratricopeptide repeat protein [bacterium]